MLEPTIEAFVARVAAWYPDDAATRPIAEQRALYERFAAAWTPALPADVDTRDARLGAFGDGREIRLRRYRSRCAAACGTVLFFHGGGFVVGSLDSHALMTARIAADTGLDVIAVDYRLAPEHRAPAAFDDCLAVTWPRSTAGYRSNRSRCRCGLPATARAACSRRRWPRRCATADASA